MRAKWFFRMITYNYTLYNTCRYLFLPVWLCCFPFMMLVIAGSAISEELRCADFSFPLHDNLGYEYIKRRSRL